MASHAGAGVRKMTTQGSVAASYYRPRTWRPAPFASVSLVIHAAGAAALAVDVTAWPWIVAMLATNHALLTPPAFLPPPRLPGPNTTPLPPHAARPPPPP